jgi:hypothetical protein
VWPRPYQRPIQVWHGSATSEESVDLAARPLQRPAVLGERHQPHRVVREVDLPLPGALGALRPRSGADRGRRRHGRRPRGPNLPADPRRLSAALRGQSGALQAGGSPGGLRDLGGLRRAQLRPDRQPAAGHREGAAPPRGVRPHGAPSPRGRRGTARRRASRLPRAVPVPRRPRAAPRDPRPTVRVGSRASDATTHPGVRPCPTSPSASSI